eukprot:gene58010-biopygen33283
MLARWRRCPPSPRRAGGAEHVCVCVWRDAARPAHACAGRRCGVCPPPPDDDEAEGGDPALAKSILLWFVSQAHAFGSKASQRAQSVGTRPVSARVPVPPSLSAMAAAAALTVAPAAGACSSAADCQLNGACVGGACRCAAAWTGEKKGATAARRREMEVGAVIKARWRKLWLGIRGGTCAPKMAPPPLFVRRAPVVPSPGAQCERLDLLPADPAKGGLRAEGVSSWGGSVLHDAGGDGLWHMFAAVMEGGCGLHAWRPNSAIAHATAADPEGPYTVRAPDGTVLIYHIGAGGNETGPGSDYATNCSAGCTG